MAEKKKKEDEETSSSSLIPEQSDSTFRELMISPHLSEEESLEDFISVVREIFRAYAAPSAASDKMVRPPSEPLCETDSPVSHVSMKSDSSMYQPLYFNLERKQSQLTEEPSSCSVWEEDVKDPVRLLCGHRSCKQCVCSHWDQYGLTADYPCKKCGKRSERDQDLQSVLLEKTIKRVETETEKAQAEREKAQAERERAQAEKEKFELEKRKLTLEIQSLEQQGKYTNYDHGVYVPNKGITYIPYI